MTKVKQYPEGLIGRKLGMTQVFDEDGRAIPVTMLEMGPCTILDVRRQDKDGYSAVQFGFSPKKSQRVNKSLMGHFQKAAKGAFYCVREIRCDVDTLGWELGNEVKLEDVFEANEFVDVTACSIGRGFAGVFKRHNMKGQPATRGTHEYRRHGGAIGNRKTPGRVFKNKRMPGHLGNAKVTIQNLKVVDVLHDEGVILVKGAVPGHKGSFIEVRKAVKSYTGAVRRVAEPVAEQQEEQQA